MNATVRPARADDAPAIRELLTANDMLYVDGEVFSEIALVVDTDHGLIGYAQMLIGRPVAVITQVAIHPDHHRAGAGVRLLTALELLARHYGIKAWVAFSSKPDVDSILTRLGAERTGACTGYLRRLE